MVVVKVVALYLCRRLDVSEQIFIRRTYLTRHYNRSVNTNTPEPSGTRRPLVLRWIITLRCKYDLDAKRRRPGDGVVLCSIVHTLDDRAVDGAGRIVHPPWI